MMRIVFVTDSFAKNMGYSVNTLPRYLTRLGADVHIVTPALAPYYRREDFATTYGQFSNSGVSAPGSVEELDGYTLHTTEFERLLGHVRIKGLHAKLKALQPTIVQQQSTMGWLPLEVALMQPFLGYKFFTGNHTTASVFPLAQRESHIWEPARLKSIVTRAFPGRIVSMFSEKCYATTADCARVARDFYGQPARIVEECPLGVDTEIFYPRVGLEAESSRRDRRDKLGVLPEELLCVYSGRFAEDKNPVVLARAVASLRAQGLPFRALFVGSGAQEDRLGEFDGSIVHPFVPFRELADWFHAADIGVWPTQESTSMLDAAACGLPIVVNDTIEALDRIDGNGLVYRLNDSDDLARVLRTLITNEARRKLGDVGASRMASLFSWTAIARRRMTDYENAVAGR
ncbi:MAG: hypothetical protein JWM95_521 [Gemmatimonadetes bacterium]|nr:hypothetical protein [Gemmatimonadota bacterium]